MCICAGVATAAGAQGVWELVLTYLLADIDLCMPASLHCVSYTVQQAICSRHWSARTTAPVPVHIQHVKVLAALLEANSHL
jgi:hypothetical protein